MCSAGGVIVTALGGKIICDNTLDRSVYRFISQR